ncbi:MAG TPA: DUF4129 domain-containing protein [Gemmatimonadaceae bacterium]|nr:DUF4129 domain-containing protein [Gemmatimonadaceae bacterium]
MLLQGGAPPWPAGAVHDTVAAIASQAAYRRSMSTTLMNRLLAWVFRLIRDFFDLFGGSGIGRAVTYTLLVVLVLLVVARFVVAARTAQEERLHAGDRGTRARASDPWGDAERLAGSGRYTEAAHALFAALLMGFAARGEVRLHASKTAGDYARELRRRGSPRERAFQAFRFRYDRIIYGEGQCSTDDYTELLREARPLLERAA